MNVEEGDCQFIPFQISETPHFCPVGILDCRLLLLQTEAHGADSPTNTLGMTPDRTIRRGLGSEVPVCFDFAGLTYSLISLVILGVEPISTQNAKFNPEPRLRSRHRHQYRHRRTSRVLSFATQPQTKPSNGDRDFRHAGPLGSASHWRTIE